MLRASGLIFFASAIAVLTGCGKSEIERAVVHGTVRFDGEPMQSGVIRFVPADGTATPPGAAQIVNGAYRVEARGGVPIGTHKIEIQAFRPLPPGAKNAEFEAMKKEHPHFTFPDPQVQYVPERYNEKTELAITVSPGSSQIEHNIEMTK